jgi:hypothetical protein
VGSFVRSATPEPASTLHWLRLAIDTGGLSGPESLLGALPRDASVEANLRFARDADGAYVESSLPAGFDAFRVEVHGVVVADLGWGLNVSASTDRHGWTALTARLDPALRVDDALVYPPEANVLVSQRAHEEPGGELRFPLFIPMDD